MGNTRSRPELLRLRVRFLQQNDRLSALVDIESQVIGPRELDFIALEYSLQSKKRCGGAGQEPTILEPLAVHR